MNHRVYKTQPHLLEEYYAISEQNYFHQSLSSASVCLVCFSTLTSTPENVEIHQNVQEPNLKCGLFLSF